MIKKIFTKGLVTFLFLVSIPLLAEQQEKSLVEIVCDGISDKIKRDACKAETVQELYNISEIILKECRRNSDYLGSCLNLSVERSIFIETCKNISDDSKKHLYLESRGYNLTEEVFDLCSNFSADDLIKCYCLVNSHRIL